MFGLEFGTGDSDDLVVGVVLTAFVVEDRPITVDGVFALIKLVLNECQCRRFAENVVRRFQVIQQAGNQYCRLIWQLRAMKLRSLMWWDCAFELIVVHSLSKACRRWNVGSVT